MARSPAVARASANPPQKKSGNSNSPEVKRRLPVGAEIVRGGVHFRVWAPAARKLEVVLMAGSSDPTIQALQPERDGYFSGIAPARGAGTRYKIRINGEPGLTFPDPASRFQPDGPFGDSEVIDPRFEWTDADWPGVEMEGQVIYEMHIGTFTKEGTWKSAAGQLEELARIGISIVEVMPVADFPGRFGWGYDGVNLYAPTWLYGRPEDFRHFVNAAHHHAIGVILDVVYNHFGPDGNYLRNFSPDYFSKRYATDWGEALNFEDENCEPVREYIISNAAYWTQEFHLDGLRLDATQNIYDRGTPHILAEVCGAVRTSAKGRKTIVVAENEPQDTTLLRSPKEGGYGIDAMWNDDFHHSAVVALTGHNEAYYTDYLGSAQEFISAAKHGFLYQGQWYAWQNNTRGTPSLDLPPSAFIAFIQNHDQVANSAWGTRLHSITSPGRYRAMTALLLLGPATPMLFQGQEFAANTPFRYFSDHKPEISKHVLRGRAEFLAQFLSLRAPETQALLADPGNPTTFESCKLDFNDRDRHAHAYTLHRELLWLRRNDPVFRLQGKGGLEGAVLSQRALVLRYFGPKGDDRLLLVNLSMDLHLRVCPEPLLAPVRGTRWRVLLSTEDPRFGGLGVYSPNVDGPWILPGEAAVVLAPLKPETAEELSDDGSRGRGAKNTR